MNAKEWTPGEMFAVSGGYWQGFALHAAVKLGLFTLCGDERLGGDAIAKRLGADRRGAETLLHALTAMGLLSRSAEGFANTPFSRMYLARDSRQYMGHIIMHHHYLVTAWAHLDQAVLSGKPTRGFDPETMESELESFLMGMFNIASGIAPAVSPDAHPQNHTTKPSPIALTVNCPR